MEVLCSKCSHCEGITSNYDVICDLVGLTKLRIYCKFFKPKS